MDIHSPNQIPLWENWDYSSKKPTSEFEEEEKIIEQYPRFVGGWLRKDWQKEK